SARRSLRLRPGASCDALPKAGARSEIDVQLGEGFVAVGDRHARGTVVAPQADPRLDELDRGELPDRAVAFLSVLALVPVGVEILVRDLEVVPLVHAPVTFDQGRVGAVVTGGRLVGDQVELCEPRD